MGSIKKLTSKVLIVSIFSASVLLFKCDTPVAEAPQNVTATDGRYHDKIVITWDRVEGAEYYKVWRADCKNGDYSAEVCNTPDSEEPLCKDWNVVSLEKYYYKAQGFAGEYHSEISEPDEGSAKEKCQMPNGSESTLDVALRLLLGVDDVNKLRDEALDRMDDLPEPIDNPYIPGDEEIFEFVKEVCVYPHRRIGSPESLMAENYLYDKFQEFGLSQVVKEPVEDIDVYAASNWKLLIEDGGPTIDYPCFYVVNTGFTGPEGVSGDMVYVGEGTNEDFDNAGDIEGKIAVGICAFPNFPLGLILLITGGDGSGGAYWTSDPNDTIGCLESIVMTFARQNFPNQYDPDAGPNSDSIYWQAHNCGAKGLVLILSGHPGDTNTSWGPYDGIIKPMPALYISSYKEAELTEIARSGKSATIKIEGTITRGVAHNILGILTGQSQETIMVSSHHDAAHKGATEDGTGVAMVLAMAESWAQMPLSERPKTMLFILTAGHFYRGIGSHDFALEHKYGIMEDVVVDINIEHVSAKDIDPETPDMQVVEGRSAFSMIFINDDSLPISVAMRAMMQYEPDRVVCSPGWILGDVPPGEAGHYHIECDVNYIHWIGAPYYLLTAEDTLDKVDVESLNHNACMISNMIGTYMAAP